MQGCTSRRKGEYAQVVRITLSQRANPGFWFNRKRKSRRYLVRTIVLFNWGARYGYGPKQIISETGTLRSETFIFRNIVP